MKKKSIFWAACLILGITAGFFFYQRETPLEDKGQVESVQRSVLNVHLKISDDGDGKMEFTDLKVDPGTSALDLLSRVATEEGFDLTIEESSFGKYLAGIGGRESDESHFWAFWVNGQMAQVGVGSYQVQEGDVIEFKWTEM